MGKKIVYEEVTAPDHSEEPAIIEYLSMLDEFFDKFGMYKKIKIESYNSEDKENKYLKLDVDSEGKFNLEYKNGKEGLEAKISGTLKEYREQEQREY